MNNYSHKLYFEDLNSTLGPFGMIQLVDFKTWSCSVNGAWRYFTIDHVYTTDETLITRVKPIEVLTGDHCLVLLTIN